MRRNETYRSDPFACPVKTDHLMDGMSTKHRRRSIAQTQFPTQEVRSFMLDYPEWYNSSPGQKHEKS